MKLGMVGLGKMGGNMTERLRRGGHEIASFDRGGGGTAASLEELVGQLEAPRVVWLMIPAGDPTEQAVTDVLGLLEADDVIVDGGNSNFRDSKRRAATAAEKGHPLRRHRRLRRDLGPQGGLLPHGRWRRPRRSRSSQPAFETLAPPERLRARRPVRRGALREDGPQRDRVRTDAGLRRGLRGDGALRVRPRPRRRSPGSGATARSCARGSSSSLYDALREGRRAPGGDQGLRRGLGRGPLDDRRGDRPRTSRSRSSAPSLYARFASRQDESFAAKVNAALRNEFGGHAVKKADRDASRPRTRCSKGSSAAARPSPASSRSSALRAT